VTICGASITWPPLARAAGIHSTAEPGGAAAYTRGMNLVRSDVPFRLDRLPWSRWHWAVVIGLGITWVLDGLEVTIVSSVGARLEDRSTLGLSADDVGLAATSYLLGAVLGALGFGVATDRYGRKRLFLITLSLYIAATIATAFSWNLGSLAVFRFLTGMGIGGEYSAINSTIDELIPARNRGWTDLAINGTWWLGTMVGSAASLVLLDPHLVNQQFGWRLAFGMGAVLGLAVLLLRSTLPESPRWLLTHDRPEEAARVVTEIEVSVARTHEVPASDGRTIEIDRDHRTTFLDVLRTMVTEYSSRTVLALSLMISQAFLYNAIFFTQSLALRQFFAVRPQDVGLYAFPFAIGNLLGPLVLGRLFDRIGRRAMIGATYLGSGVALGVVAFLFHAHAFDARSITIGFSIVFFMASAGASAAYLTASEIFPIEARAFAIAIVYAVGTLVGGAAAPWIFGKLIASGSVDRLTLGYAFGAAMMVAGGIVALAIGVDAEGKSLEEIAAPRSAAKQAPAASSG